MFGPRQKYDSDYSGVITVFINKLLNRETPIIFGHGNQVRDFVHVKDVVQANILAMDSERAAGEIFNISSGNATSILELLQMVKVLTGADNVQPQFTSQRPGDIISSLGPNDKARNYLKYNPEISIMEGLAETIKYVVMEKENTPTINELKMGRKNYIHSN